MTDSPKPLLIDREALGGMLGISERQVSRLCDAGRLPKPIALGGCRRWPVEEIESWIRAGCPPRREWENLRSVTSAPREHAAGQ